MANEVQREITIEGSIEEVWTFVTGRLGDWVGGDVEAEPRVGAPISVRWPDGSMSRGLVEVVDAPRRFGFRWRRIDDVESARVGEATRVEFVLASTGERQTIVTVTESAALMPRALSLVGAPA